MHLDSRDLRYFEVIAGLGHVRAAAEQLNLSQPAVSKCIARLEQNIGARLFEREGRGIRLTPVGEALLQQARRLNVINANALRDIAGLCLGRCRHPAPWLWPCDVRVISAHCLCPAHPAYARCQSDHSGRNELHTTRKTTAG
ncbi:LysR family transcriptional regulator [Acetobacter sp. DmW_043]|uniref:LysR family transcriptional regulator n=1 Tax=Acetobacter sp. DmW_043 TaxID=1670658 RepID=UPI000A38B392|nr:LysR family transcriptional regulator [Acetobacter sp. DmW_043]